MNLSRTDMVIYVLERFIILMFDRTSECTDLDSARKQLFTKKSRTLDQLPPTSHAFSRTLNGLFFKQFIAGLIA